MINPFILLKSWSERSQRFQEGKVALSHVREALVNWRKYLDCTACFLWSPGSDTMNLSFICIRALLTIIGRVHYYLLFEGPVVVYPLTDKWMSPGEACAILHTLLADNITLVVELLGII